MDVLNIIITIAATLLILTVLIVAHELGHYLVAKKRGIRVDEFSIGFGPKLFKWNRGETQFTVRAIPAGGYVKFPDDVDEDPKPGDLRAASIKSRALTIVAGPVMNVIVAVVITAVLLMTYGDAQFVVQQAGADSPAYAAGLREGDVVREFDGVRLDFFYDWQDVQNNVTNKGLAESVPVQVERDGKTENITLPGTQTPDIVNTSFGLQPKIFNFFEAIGLSFKWLFLQMREILTALGKLFFTFQGVENMAGIVGTAAVVGTAVQTGFDMVLKLVALISVNLAIINLLPIPALDGGKLVLYGVEAIRKKPAPEKVEGILNLVGMVLIIGLAVFLVIQDIGRLMPGL